MTEAVQERVIKLLEHDPELARSLRPERVPEATRTAAARVVSLEPGARDTSELIGGHGPTYGLLVLDGLLTRTVLLRDIAAAQLLGPGDLIPTEPVERQGLVPTRTRWTVLEPTEVAVLDEYFLMTVRRWPEIVAALFEQVAEQATRLDTQRALCHLPRVEDRLHALLWFLAERWGRVTPQGILVPLKLTHELLGQLVGAKRPTVSLALKALDENGAVHRRADGAWLLERGWESGPASAAGIGGANRVAEEPQPEPTPDASGTRELSIVTDPAVSERISVRVDRMRIVHERARPSVVSILERSSNARQRTTAVREGVGVGPDRLQHDHT